MPEKLSRGARATLRQAVVIAYDVADDETRVAVRLAAQSDYATPQTVDRADLTDILPPIQPKGARVGAGGADYAVVLHDPATSTYVLRRAADGRLIIRPDRDVYPLSGKAAEVDEAPPETPMAVPLVDFSALAEPVAAAPRETGPNCDHTDMDAVCDADGCLGEMPF